MYIKTQFGEFEWDDVKAEINFHKHQISFEEAIHLFKGLILTESIEEQDYEEERQISFGVLHGSLIAAVVHTDRQQKKRIISARPASRDERERFAAFIESRDQTP